MAKSAKERDAARAARQALKAQFAAAGKGRPSDKQLDKAATKAINQLNKASSSSGSNKQATQKFISGIISDGRVTQQEAQKAASKGVSLARIEKAQTKSFQPGNVFSKSTSTPGAPGRLTSTQAQPDRRVQQTTAQPTYSPLVIQGAAQKVFDQGRPAAAPAPAPQPQTQTQQTGYSQPEFDTSFYDSLLAGQNEMINNLNMKIGDLTGAFSDQLGQLTTALDQERADSAAAMQEMQGNFAQALSQAGGRERVQGIRFADRGTGGASQAQLSRRGLRGTFGRGGERLMKISSLNV
jgi:hypothetical protein